MSQSLDLLVQGSLQRVGELQEPDPSFAAPSYMRAADIHSLANGNRRVTDDDGNFVSDAGSFVAASLISGGAQLYNILPSVGNMLGGDFEQVEIHDVMQSIDDDLSAYYEEHEGAVDTVGFILSSFVPGMAGIKGLRAVQSAGILRLESAMKSGRIGETTGKALGLLSPSREKHIRNAIQELTTNKSIFTLSNRNVLRSMGAGMGQNILEAAAFEVAVAATLFDSPILEEQDVGDLASNIVFGSVVFGAVGGIIDATRGVYKIKGAVQDADLEAMPWTHYAEPVKKSGPEERVAVYWEQANNIPAVPKELGETRAAFLTQAAGKKKEKLLDLVRREVGELAGGDQQTAQQWFNLMNQGPSNGALKELFGLKSISKITETDKLAKQMEKAAARDAKGKGTLTGKGDTPSDADLLQNTEVSYVKVYGEDAGNTITIKPVPTTLADSLKKNQRIEVDDKSVKVLTATKQGDKTATTFTQSMDPSSSWSPVGATVEEASARNIWAQNLSYKLGDAPQWTHTKKGKTFKDTVIVNETDLPLLEKMYRDFEPGMSVRLEDGSIRAFQDTQTLMGFIVGAKQRMAMALSARTNKGIFLGSVEAVEARLIQITGLKFDLLKGLDDKTIGQRTNIAKRFLSKEEQELLKDVDMEGLFTQIGLNINKLTELPLHRLVQTLKHEEGHQIYDIILKIGGVPASSLPKLKKEMIAASKKMRPLLWKSTDPDDIKYANGMHELMADTFSYFSQFEGRLSREAPEFSALFANGPRGLMNALKPIPADVVRSYMAQARKLTQEEVAAMTNVRTSYLSGVENNVLEHDMFAMQSVAEFYTDNMVAAGLHKAKDGMIPTWKQPTYLRTVHDKTPMKDLNGHVITEMAAIKEMQRLYVQKTDRAFAGVLGEDAAKFIPIDDSLVLRADRGGSGPTAAGAAMGSYGSLASVVQFIGNSTSGVIRKFQDATREALTPALHKLAQSERATIEWSTLNANLRAIPDQYVLSDDGTELVLRSVAEAEATLAAGGTPKAIKNIAEDAPDTIPLNTPEVRELARVHIERNGKRIDSLRELHTAQGAEYTWKSDVFYPTPVNPRDYQHFAQVVDESVTGIGATKMIYANSPQELEAMIAKLAGEPNLKVRTKSEIERHFKAIDEFEYEYTMNENWINSALHRKGVSSPYFVPTDSGKIIADLLEWHVSAESSLVRGAVKVKYDKQFSELHALGESFTDAATSKFSNSSQHRHAEDFINNPFSSYEKTALALKDYTKYPTWTNLNRQVDAVVSRMYERITGVVESARTPDDLARVNEYLAEAGYKGAHYDESMEFLANHPAPRGVLNSFVAKANGILATIVLRLDSLNALNNAVGATVLRATEMKAVIRAIKAGDDDAVGELAQLAMIKTPGTDDFILSPTKLIAKALDNFHNDAVLKQFYKDNGFMTRISDQYKQTLDNLTLSGNETAAELSGKISKTMTSLRKAADTGEKWTGNRLAEEFNRFVSADVMRQMTDILVKRGQMNSKTQLAYINTFVNRVEGNYLASQRPMMFQGAIGQSIGLFQTYQFNLMQQLLRHVGEGAAKDSMTLLAMQGTVYGMNGLPGFNAVNTHIIGSASGNDKHRDLYDVTYGIAGKQAGDWLSYGVASNMFIHPDLKVNLYVRGDINPRHVTLVPTDPASVPIVQATGKFLLNLKNTADKLGQGGAVWTTILQGIEHNAISRPLAGIAQTLQGLTNGDAQSYSTSKRGNVIAANDLFSLVNLGRMVGGKPLDEAIALDAAFRFKTYALKDAKQREVLGAAIKSTMLAGNTPSTEQIEAFTGKYTELGGSQTEFNKWMMQLYRTANTSQANQLVQDLNSPFNQSMQKIMGGYELKDFQP